MCSRLLVYIILPQLLAGSDPHSDHVNGTEATHVTTYSERITGKSPLDPEQRDHQDLQEPQIPRDPCVWWCNNLYYVIAIAGCLLLLLLSIILSAISCCLWRKVTRQEGKSRNNTGAVEQELDSLCLPLPPDSSKSFPVEEDPPAPSDGGFSQLENCISNSGPLMAETPQGTEDQSTDPSSFPPPGDLPMP